MSALNLRVGRIKTTPDGSVEAPEPVTPVQAAAASGKGELE
jgi:hypothetical protein